MDKEIIHNVDLLKPINKKLDDLSATEVFNSSSMDLRQEIAHVESKVDLVVVELNDVK